MILRGDYQATWDVLARTEDEALLHVAGYLDEARLRHNTDITLQVLQGTIGIRPEDVFLEIGCGVGRVGQLLAPLCREWIGCDVSANMLGHARKRLAKLGNVRLEKISGRDLSGIPDRSIDAVYCTVVFMHLDEWERFSYVQEALRVLKDGGRFYCDNINLASDDGWAAFEAARAIAPADRPPHLSRCSTINEFETYFARAGFIDRHVTTRHLWVQGWGRKPHRKDAGTGEAPNG